MQSIDRIKTSDGSGNASVATVQNVRSGGATTIVVDTVLGLPPTFYGTMGTPHTFIDPVTSEEITVISEATAVDFSGHVDGSDLEIDTIAPGYVDNGSEVGDIVIIRPTTQWGDNVAEVLEQAHEDSGLLKKDAPIIDGTTLTLLGLAPRGAIIEYAAFTAPEGWLMCDGAAVLRSTYSELFDLLNPTVGTFTITIASPGVVTLNSHGLLTSDSVYFTTTGNLPTGILANTRYWVIKVNDNTFRLATSQANADAGTAINTSGTQSGVHTLRRTPYGLGDGSTTFNTPDKRGRVGVGLDASQTEFNTLGKKGGHKALQAHTHSVPTRINAGANGSDPAYTRPNNTGTTEVKTGDPYIGVTGTGDSGNIQPYHVSNYIIKM